MGFSFVAKEGPYVFENFLIVFEVVIKILMKS